MLLLLLVVILAFADLAVGGNFSPIAVGVRSALAGSTVHPTLWGGFSSNKKQHQLPSRRIGEAAAALRPCSVECDDEPNLTDAAVYKPKSAREHKQLRSAQSAYLQRTPSRSSESGTELDFLESSRGRLSSMRDIAQVSSVQPAIATAAAAPAKTLSQTASQKSGQVCSRVQPTATAVPSATFSHADARGGAADNRPLVFWENMVCGAISRSIAQTTMHPANTMKTMLQNSRGGPDAPKIAELMLPQNFRRLTVGAGANFILSVPHGAVNFAVLEFVRKRLGAIVKSNPRLAANEERLSFGLDFLSSSISTITCSIVSTPQMMITDNIMAGNYPNIGAAITGLAQTKGIMGFYGGWWPGLVGKIPSYALTWTFFQQLKKVRNRWSHRPATDVENSVMGCMASAATVCLMIPMDTIKTRLVSQAGRAASDQAYKGIVDCAVRVFREEGLATFYRGLPPRLVSVVPMIGIQFGVYEFMKRVMLQRRVAENHPVKLMPHQYESLSILEEAMMEVAASPEHPYPAPHFSTRSAPNEDGKGEGGSENKKNKKKKQTQR